MLNFDLQVSKMRLTMAMPWLLPAAIAALLAGVDASDQASHLRQVLSFPLHSHCMAVVAAYLLDTSD